MSYDAFLSYSHAADGKLAPALQSGLQQFARPWNRMRAVRVFRDKTGLSANPGLWSAIEMALESSAYFVLLASPQAARSPWVQKEVEHWLARRPVKNVLVVLTDGEIAWDPRANDFDWQLTTALPPALRGRAGEEPLWVDLRAMRTEDQLSLANPAFREAVADLSSALRGVPKDELAGEDVKQHRKAALFRRAAIAGLTALAAGLALAAFLAMGQRNLALRNEEAANANAALAKENETRAKENEARAEQNRRRAEQNAEEARTQARRALARQLAAQAVAHGNELARHLQTSALLAIESMRLSPSVEADQSLREGLALLPRPRPLLNHRGIVRAVAFSPDGRYLATAGDDRRARLWDVPSEREVACLEHRGIVWSVAFSPDGRYLGTGSGADDVRVWDVSDWRPIGVPEARPNGPGAREEWPVSVAFSPDGRYLAGTVKGPVAWLFETATGRAVGGFPSAPGSLAAVDFAPDGTLVAAASWDQTARLWEVPSGREIAQVKHQRPVHGVAFSRDGRRWATADWDGAVRLLDVASRQEERRWRHPWPAHAVAFSPNGRHLATISGSNDNQGTIARVWNIDGGEEVARMPHEGVIYKLAFGADGRYVATASWDGTAKVWEPTTGREALRMVDDRSIDDVAFSADGRYVATGGDSGARVWEMGASRTRGSSVDAARRALAASSRTRERYFVGHGDSSLAVVEERTGRELVVIKDDPHSSTEVVAATRDGRFLGTASADGMVRLWDTHGRRDREIARWVQEEAVDAGAFSDDGRYFATASPRWRELKASRGAYVARIWEVARAQEIARISDHQPLRPLAFTDDARYLVAQADGGEPRVFPLRPADLIEAVCERAARNLTRDEWRRFLGAEPYRKTCQRLLP